MMPDQVGIMSDVRTLGDVPGHEFHGNQWAVGPAPEHGAPGSKERMHYIAWEHGKTWREKSNKLAAIKAKDPKDVNWSRDWEADTRVHSVHQAQDEIDSFKDREEKALATAKSMRGLSGFTPREHAVLLLAAKLRVMGDVPGHEFHGNQYTDSLSSSDVGKVLENQHEHVQAREQEKQYGALADTTRHEAAFLEDKFVTSDHFKLMNVNIDDVAPIGIVHEGAQSKTSGPIIVDKNKSSFGRGMYGAPPKVVILDGKHRVAAARARGDKTIQAYVGNLAIHHLTNERTKRILGDVEGHEFHGNQWTKGGGKEDDTFLSSSDDAVHAMLNGEHSTVAASSLRDVVLKAKDIETPIDLTLLTVEDKQIFAGGLNHDRLSMPQIPKEHQEEFLASLRMQGIPVTKEMVAPSKLLPTQNEISANRVGRRLAEADSKDKGALRPILTSKDRYVLDGHHRWAVMAVHDVENPRAGVRVSTVKIGLNHREALKTMKAFVKKKGIKAQALEANLGYIRRIHAAANTDNTAVHKAADKHLAAMQLAVNYGFMKGKKAVDKSALRSATTEKQAMAAVDGAPTAIHAALLQSLPKPLLACLAEGGQAGYSSFKQSRAAGDVEGHEFHGNQFTTGSFTREENGQKYATVTHTPTGATVASRIQGKTLVLDHIVVPEEHWGKGLGKTLVNKMREHAKAEGKKLETSGHATEEGTHLFQSFVKRGEATASVRRLPAFMKGGPARRQTYYKFKALASRTLAGPKFPTKFDATSEEAIKWAREHAAELAKGLSDTSRDDIREAIASALEGEGLDAAYDDILDAVGNEARAEMISRTEVMDAANEGLAQSWDQAVEDGLLSGKEKKVWIATSDACPECEEVDGEEVPMDDDFSVGDDPPLHPNCRCTMGLVGE